jgi:hypothetical protein
MSQILFTISQVELKNQSQTTGTPLIYAANENNSFEWGALCSNSTTNLANFPILYVNKPIKGITFLQIATLRGQYQLYWNDGANQGDAIILLQCLTTETPYPKNQTSLWSGSSDAQVSFKLIIDFSAPANESGITLVQL